MKNQKIHSFFRQRFLDTHIAINSEIKLIESDNGEAIGFIKKIGRLYLNLCEVMDNVNICYSFQVGAKTFNHFCFKLNLTCFLTCV